ncbi:hypothetical protein APHAL10511_007965 [Amanita phalloides]|nr:hypothetical protein APHAL10511_007965 [Amanita phalloides]
MLSDDSDLTTRTTNGLHPMFLALHGQGEGNNIEIHERQRVQKDSLSDIFDALTALDRIDGGVSLLIWSPGFTIPPDFSLNGIALDTYITTRAIVEAEDIVQAVLASFIQVFGKGVVLPHLHHFTKKGKTERINVPFELGHVTRLCVVQPYIRFPYMPRTGCYRFQCVSFDALPIRIESGKFLPSCERLKSIIGEAWERWEDNGAPKENDVKPFPLSDRPIISFGAKTDTALEHLKLLDTIIPRLHDLSHTVHSSKWEKMLRGPEWGFSFEQAAMISRAMILDLDVKQHGTPIWKSGDISGMKIIVYSSIVTFILSILFYVITA